MTGNTNPTPWTLPLYYEVSECELAELRLIRGSATCFTPPPFVWRAKCGKNTLYAGLVTVGYLETTGDPNGKTSEEITGETITMFRYQLTAQGWDILAASDPEPETVPDVPFFYTRFQRLQLAPPVDVGVCTCIACDEDFAEDELCGGCGLCAACCTCAADDMERYRCPDCDGDTRYGVHQEQVEVDYYRCYTDDAGDKADEARGERHG